MWPSISSATSIRPSATRVAFAVILALPAAPAAAATFGVGGISLEVSTVDYQLEVYGDQGSTYLHRVHDTATTEFGSLWSVTGGPRIEELIEPVPPDMDPFPQPFNGSATAFASAVNTSTGDMEVGVSGRSVRQGAMRAVAEWAFGVTPRGGPTQIGVTSEIPEMMVALIGGEWQEGPNFPPLTSTIPDGYLQYSAARSYVDFELRDPDGDLVSTDRLGFYEARLNKVTVDSTYPHGFAFNLSPDLETLVDNGLGAAGSLDFDVLGGLDLFRWTIDPFTVNLTSPVIPEDHTGRFIFGTYAATFTPIQGVEVSGGEARVGDPFTFTVPETPRIGFSIVDQPPSPPPVGVVPLPASSVLLVAGLGALALSRMRRRPSLQG